MPNAGQGTALLIQPATSSGPLLNAASENRVKFNIQNFATENFYFGFNPRMRAPANGVPANVYYRIMNPLGVQVVAPTLVPTVGAGFIPNYAQAVAGPNVSGLNPTGYTPIQFTPAMNGDFYIEIYRSNDGGVTQVAGNNGEAYFIYFDFTVSTAAFAVRPGRVHSQKWSFIVYDPLNVNFLPSLAHSFLGSYYALTQDSSVVRVNFPLGFKPLGYTMAMNYYGVNNTSNFPVDRVSVYTGTVTPAFLNGFRVFLSDPDPTAFTRSTAAAAPAITNQVFGCPGNYFIPFFIDKPGDVAILLDLNGTLGYQAGTTDVLIERYGLPAGNQVVGWNGLDGLGAPVSGILPIDITITIFRGRTNVPIFDAELNQNGFSVDGISPIPGARKLFWADNTLAAFGTCPSGAGAATQGTNNSTGAGVSMTASLLGVLGPAHAWDGGATFAVPAPIGGLGSATPEACDDFGNARTINTWFWANEVASTPVSRFLPDCDIDNDGVVDATDIDDDNDGIPDLVESGGIDPNGDADSDGIPNFLDPTFPGFVDTDFDGVNDNFDTDMDGIIDAYDVDSDNDGMADGVEANGGTVPPGFDNGTGTFTGTVGSNGMPDNAETVPGSGVSRLPNPDTDGDGIPDAYDIDSDNDGIVDNYEIQTGGGPYVPPSGVDANGNGRDDAYDGGGAITSTDIDGDGHPDYRDLDTDNDGIPDITESGNGNFDTNNDGEIDSTTDADGDGLMDVCDGTNTNGGPAFVPGGSGDVNDPNNINNPLNDVDFDNDGLPNWADLDSDNDGIPDITETGNGNFDVNNDGKIDSATDVDGDGLQDVVDGFNNNGSGGFVAGGSGNVIDNDNLNNTNNDIDADNDGTPNYLDLDADNDGIPDITETGNGNLDVNNDGKIDSVTDVDNDGLIDGVDGVNNNGAGGFVAGGAGDVIDNDNINNTSNDINADNDNLPNFLDVDSDNDGIADIVETGNGNFDANNDGQIDSGTDVDGDGLQDVVDGFNNSGAGGFVAGGAGDVIDNDNLNNPSNDINLDNDGLPNYLDLDADNDGIADITETLNGNFDTNNDGMIDSSTDADGDGLMDVTDGVNNTGAGGFTAGGAGDVIDNDNLNSTSNDINADGDGFPNFLDLDADNDGLADIFESNNGALDVNNDGMIDSSTDVDRDGLSDVADGVNNTGAGGFTAGGAGDVIDNDNLNNATNDINGDNDGLPNFLDVDSDNDGIADLVETGNGNFDVNNDGQIDSATDADGDGLMDVTDGVNNNGAGGFTAGGAGDVIDNDNPNNASNDINADPDGLPNYLDLDSDNDGIVDLVETLNGNFDTNNDGMIDSSTDADGDGLMDVTDGVNNTGAGGFTAGNAGDVIDNDNLNATANDVNADNDALPNYLDLDADNDGLVDMLEANNGALDVNNDGMIDSSTDADADGLADVADGVNNTGAGGFTAGGAGDVIDNDNLNNTANDINADSDGFPNFLDLDADNDGLPDITESFNGALDVNNDGMIDSGTDADGDGLKDVADGVNNSGAGGFTAGSAGDVIDNDNLNNAANDINTDPDGLPNYLDVDSDNDGIADITETMNGNFDTNNDGQIDSATDADGDGLADVADGVNNTGAGGFTAGGTGDVIDNDNLNNASNDIDLDNDGFANYLDLDADNDGLADLVETSNGNFDVNNDGMIDSTTDVDLDGLADVADGVNNSGAGGFTAGAAGDVIVNNNLNATANDVNADSDGLPNFLDLDADNDGLPDIFESMNGALDVNNDGMIDAAADVDGDGLKDAADGVNNSGAGGFTAGGAGDVIDNDNLNATTNDINADNDGLPNFLDIDSDNDGIADLTESMNGNFDANNDGQIDSATDVDGDGLMDVTDGINNSGAGGFTAGAAGDVLDNDNPNNPGNDINADNDALPNYIDLDADNDGIADIAETLNGTLDANNDGMIDSATDADGDGLKDVADGVNNTGAGGFTAGSASDVVVNNNLNAAANDINADTDALPNFLDVDADNDGISDIDETLNTALDANNDGMIDNVTDADADGLIDVADGVNNTGAGGFTAGATSDVIVNGNFNAVTNDVNADLDALPNFLDLDSDNDGLTDIVENANGSTTNDLGGGGSIDGMYGSAGITDANGDGWQDGIGSAPINDFDVDGKPNYLDIDADDDGIPDYIEGVCTGCINSTGGLPAGADANNNGIIDSYEGINAGNNGVGGNSGTTPYNHESTGLPDFIDLDADDDSYPDWTEGFDLNCNGDAWDDIILMAFNYETANGIPGNYTALDTDGDNVPNWLDNVVGPGAVHGIRMPFITFGSPFYVDANGNGLVDVYDPLVLGTISPTPNCDAVADDDYRDLNTTTNLPVNFLNNNAVKVGEKSRISWSISEPENVNRFEVERKVAGQMDFEFLGSVTANPNGVITGDYTMDDNAPAIGSNLYRIRVIGMDGDVIYSSVMEVIFSNTSIVGLSPNPVGSLQMLNLSYDLTDGDALTGLEVIDAQGRLVMTRDLNLEGAGSESIDVSSLAKGQYSFIVTGIQTRKVIRITKM
ncbi:MAG: hypothetical protein U0176_08845 [Bacteroidia bacterium]